MQHLSIFHYLTITLATALMHEVLFVGETVKKSIRLFVDHCVCLNSMLSALVFHRAFNPSND